MTQSGLSNFYLVKFITKGGRKTGFLAGRLFLLAVFLLAAVWQPSASAAAAPLWAADASVSLPGGTTEILMGENFTFDAVFENTSAEVGYGPFIDLIFPVTGKDGAGAEIDDGIDFISATYLGVNLVRVVQTFPDAGGGTGCVNHPYAVDNTGAPVQVCGTAGDKLVTLQMPFGSLVPAQPDLVATITAKLSPLADVGAGNDLLIRARGGYQFGNDELDNPASDPSILDAWDDWYIRPTILRLTKAYIGPEDETATGPNFPRRYRLTVDIADTQTLTDLDITDVLPINMQYLDVISTTIRGTSTSTTDISTPSTSNPGGTLTRRFASVTGTTAGNDAEMIFEYFIPLRDLDGNYVIPPANGDDQPSYDDAKASGSWDPTDPRDDPIPPDPYPVVVTDARPIDHTLWDKSIAIQKTVGTIPAGGQPQPGTVLEYTLNFQISDYFAFDTIVISDTISDGQLWDSTFTPTLTVSGNKFDLPAAGFTRANYTDPITPDLTDGTTDVTFNISAELLSRGEPTGRLVGGCVPVADDRLSGGTVSGDPDCSAYNNGGTTATVKFRTVIQNEFLADTSPNSQSVDQGDTLDNTVSINGRLLEVDDLSPYAPDTFEADGSGAGVQIRRGALVKTIYAKNGVVCSPQPCTDVKSAPGETITYRFTYALPTSDVEDMKFTDFLPLPIFRSTEITLFDDEVSSAAPVAGHAKFGPTDTFYAESGIVPTITTSASQNSITFDYGDYDNSVPPTPEVVDILFTVTTRNDPFADGLFLTNQVQAFEGSTNASSQTANSIVQIQITEPNVFIRKGVVWSDNPANNLLFPPPVPFSGTNCARFTGTIDSLMLQDTDAFNSSITDVDAGDRLTYAVVIENQGSGFRGAYDVTVKDVVPANTTYLPGSLCVTDGTGAALPYTALTGGFTGDGIQIDDPSADQGGLTAYTETGGTNIAVITFDVTVNSSMPVDFTATNTSTLTRFASTEGGPNFIPGGKTDSADLTTLPPQMVKNLDSTSLENSANSKTQVAIGEIATYSVEITVPEGTTLDARLRDVLPSGMAFVKCLSVSAPSGVSTNLSGGFSAACPAVPEDPAVNPTVSADARTIEFDLGDITNTNNTSGTEVITIVYQAVVRNIASTNAGNTLVNGATFYWDDGDVSDSGDTITIVEPQVTISKSASPVAGDAGDTITFTIDITAASGTNRTDAYNVVFADAVPAGMTYVNNTLSFVSGGGRIAPTTINGASGPNISADWDKLAPGETSRLTFDVTLDYTLIPGQALSNTGRVTYTSLPGSQPGPLSVYTNNVCERTGDSTQTCGGTSNDYSASDSDGITGDSAQVDKSVNTTSETHTTGANVVIGEVVTYDVKITIPEGSTPNAQLIDTLQTGMAFVKCVGIDVPANVTTDLTGGFSAACPLVPESPAVNPTVSADARTLTFNLGNITNTNNTAGDEVITLTYQVIVTNISTNDAGDTLVNFARFNWTGGTTTDSAETLTILEPRIDVQKAVAVGGAGGAAGDPVTYTVTLRHPTPMVSGDIDAFDLSLNDPLPVSAITGNSLIEFGASPTITVVDSGGSVDSSYFELVGSNATGWTLRTRAGSEIDFPYSPIRTITVSVTGTLSYQAPLGSAVSNTATGRWTSINGTLADTSIYTTDDTERTGSQTPAFNDHVDTGVVSFNVLTPGVSKTITATDQTFTTGNNVAIGEIVTYRVTYAVPQGTAYEFRSVDTLDAGLAFVDCVSVSNPDGRLTAANGFTCTNAAYNDGSRTMTVDFGDLSNNDTDPLTTEQIVLEYTVVVLNTSGNNRTPATNLNNAVTLSWREAPVTGTLRSVSGSAPNVTVVEPVVTISKTRNTANGDAGDTITFTINITATSGTGYTDAYNVLFRDTIPTGMTYVDNSLTFVSGSGRIAPTSTSGATGPNISASWDVLTPGQTSRLTFQVTLDSNVTPTQSITNTGEVTYTSLPGTVAGPLTTHSASGCERTGNNTQPCGGASNDLRATSAVAVSVPNVAISKALYATSGAHTTGNNVTIGEIVTYDLTITLPEGVTPNTTPSLRVTDRVPAGMQYVNGSGQVIPGTFNGTVPAPTISLVTSSGNGDDVRFDFGQITTTGDNNTTNNSFTIRLDLLVLDVPGNVGVAPQTTLTNDAQAQSGTASTITSNTHTTTVVEPRLAMTKSVNPTSAAVNDSVTYTLVVTNNGTLTAYDVLITDPVSETVFEDIACGTIPAGFTCSTSSAAGITTIRLESDGSGSGGQIATGAPNAKTFTFTAKVKAISNGQVVPNTATIENETTFPGTVSGERDEPNVTASANLTGIAPDVRIVKTDGKASVIPGETIVYTLTVDNIGTRATEGVQVTETVPSYTTFLPAHPDNAGWTCAANTAGSTCTYDIPGTLALNTPVTLKFAVQVDAVVPAGTLQVVNNASAADNGTHGADINPTNNNTSDTDTLTAAPNLAALKSVTLFNDINGDTIVNPGDTLRYTITLTNSGNQDASAVIFTDTPDANTALVVGSVTTSQGSVTSGNTAGDTTVGINVGTLTGGGSSVTITFNVVVDNPLAAGVSEVRNQGTATGGNIPNTPTNRVDTPVVAAPDLQISKVDDVTQVIPGDSANNTITYTLTYANTGNQDATGAAITETVPANTTYVSSGSSAWSCANGAPAGTTCTLTIGNMAAGATPANATFVVRVNNTVPSGVIQIDNTVSIADDGANGADPTPANNTDDEDTPVTAVPDVYVTKTDSQTSTTPGATLTYVITVGNSGNQGAANVLVTETVPPYTTYVASGSSAWSCADGSAAGTTCTLTIASLPAGSGQNLNFRVRVNSSVPAGITQLTNTVSAADDGTNGTDPDPSNNSDDDTDDVTAQPDLTITKSDADITAVPGGNIVYTLNYSNVGNQTATGATITETIPANTSTAGVTNTGWTCGGTSAGSTCTYTIGDLAASGSGSVSFTVRVDNPFPAGVTQIDNTASIADDGANGTDPTPANNSDDEPTPVNAAPDIAAVKSVSPTGAVEPGDTLTYTIVITNSGDENAAAVVFADTPDANTTLVVGSVTTTQGSVTTGNTAGDSSVSVSLGTIIGGDGSATITFQVTINDPAAAGVDEVLNQGTVTGSNFPDEDTNEVDNPLTALPDLVITKTDSDVSVATGDTITYSLSYSNVGNQDATGVTVTETIPDNTNTTGLTNTGWTCGGTSAGSTCTYTIGDLASGGGGTLSFTVRVNGTLPAGVTQIDNTTSIADDGANGADPTPANNSDDEDTPVTAAPDIYVTKTDNPDPVIPGNTITYTINVGNQGDQGATNVLLTETVPANTTYVASGSSAWSCADGAAAGTSCTLTIASLPAGGSQNLTFIVEVADPFPAATTQVQNTVSAADDGANGPDGNPTDNQDDEPTDVTSAPDLRITKTDGVTQVAAGSRLTYTITLDNIGDKVATNVVVTDVYPENTTYVSSSPAAASHNPATRTLVWDPIASVSPSDAPRTITVTVDVDSPLDPSVTSLTNTVSVADDGANGTDPTGNNTATDVDAIGASGKSLTGTDMTHTGGSDVAIGEIVTYTINLVVRPGALEELKLVDTLDQGLALVDCQVSGDANLSASSGDFADLCDLPPDGTIFKVEAEPASSTADVDQGRKMTLDFGTLTNTGLTDGNLTITYRAVVLNSAGNQDGKVLNNNAVWSWKGSSLPLTPVSVTVVEPTLAILKETNSNVATPGSIITFRLTISSAPGNTLDAFDALMTDFVPDGMTYVENSFAYVSGQTPDFLEYRLPNELRAVWSTFDGEGTPTVLEFDVEIDNSLGSRSELRNTANVEWTSLPNNVSTSRTTFNPLGTERYYDPGSEVNVYGARDSVSLNVPLLPETGFAPGRSTDLPEQPAEKAYQQTGDLTLEIPALKVTVPIVGVPMVKGEWDLTWLNRQAGYLEGTAFPTWNGNSGLTGHIFTNDGASGPFRYLDKLRFGDQVIVHAYGKKYIYSVRQVQRVQPGDLSPLKHEEKPWLTLLTCEDYDADENTFRSRLAVRAVLIRTEDE